MSGRNISQFRSTSDDGPAFDEPWQAQAFAMVVELHRRGAFTWEEWSAALSNEIHGPIERDYYQHWLCALENIVAAKKILSPPELSDRKREWVAAAAATPHGQPINLS